MRKTFLWTLLLFCMRQAHAQKDEKFSYDSITHVCSGMPFEKRARVSVTRFNVTTSTNDPATQQNAGANNLLKGLSTIFNHGENTLQASELPPTLGPNLATMLTNALQNVSCFRVLETLHNSKDATGEIDAGEQSHYAKKGSAPVAGKQLGAQIVITGEIVEYSVKEHGLKVAGIGGSKKLIKMGVIIKMENPETRDIIVSHLVRVESKSSNSVSVGIVSANNDDPAVAAVMQDAIINAVIYISHIRDSLNISADNIPGSSSAGSAGSIAEVNITLSNADFNSYSSLAGIIASLPGYSGMEKSFANNTGSFTVEYKGGTDKLLNEINQKAGARYSVTNINKTEIGLKVK